MRVRLIRPIVTIRLGITRRVLTHTLSVETRPLIGCARSYKHPIRIDYQQLIERVLDQFPPRHYDHLFISGYLQALFTPDKIYPNILARNSH